ncbi:MAG TPA: HAD-IIIA family hydrolase [Candidatus Nanoarchaeia archaeon]|nr:HAD-IIIA family hydrolase [Candidatus Nanoarchaeia archaeon]
MLPIPSLEMYQLPNILSQADAAKKIQELKAQGKTVALCHGGFDLTHPGHVKHFESAKRLCDILFVSITSDKYVESRKGAGRPIYTDKLRAYMIASLRFIDYVVISDTEKGVEVIAHLKPSIYIKGPDYISKTTPGITAERNAITAIGGKMEYTTEPPLSTTKIVEYIKKEVKENTLLLIIDRDGTLITNDDFPGKKEQWKQTIQLNNDLADYLAILQTKYKTTKIVISNQSGVARGLFTCTRVEEINQHIASLLAQKGVTIDCWQYCPDVDAAFAEKNKEKINFNKAYIKQQTKRKPSPAMVNDALAEIKKELSSFENILVIGNAEDDEKLAKNLDARYIDVKTKPYQQLVKEFS